MKSNVKKSLHEIFVESLKSENSWRNIAKFNDVPKSTLSDYLRDCYFQIELTKIPELVDYTYEKLSRKALETLCWYKNCTNSEIFDYFRPYIEDLDTINVDDCVLKTIQDLPELLLKNQSVSLDHQMKIDGKTFDVVVISDTQCRPKENLEYMLWIGNYIKTHKPDVVVHIGDHFDFPSLSSYDRGTRNIEGKRIKEDIDAGKAGFELLDKAMGDVKPRKIFVLGNHEQRLERYANDNPEIYGLIGYETLGFAEYGWEYHDFLKPVEVGGVFFTHYVANPFTGKPYGGSVLSILKNVGRSFVAGHKQCLDFAVKPNIDGKMTFGLICGASYPHNEGYKGHQGNIHFRGITHIRNLKDGFGDISFIQTETLKKDYYST